MILNELPDSGIEECHGGMHVEMLVEGERPGEPRPGSDRLPALHHKILRKGMLPLFLGEGEIRLRKEILVERHVVVDILPGSYGGEIHLLPVVAYCKAVVEHQAVVEACVVVAYLAGLLELIGIPSLAEEIGRQGVLQISGACDAPVLLESQIHESLPVDFPAVVFIGEETS